jgi:hypothetical protein
MATQTSLWGIVGSVYGGFAFVALSLDWSDTGASRDEGVHMASVIVPNLVLFVAMLAAVITAFVLVIGSIARHP